ncbi:hypothetical protein IE53DRAFT_383248 [Violaceomyces palustris]|uniref:Uncharacterized protein n=1 Tax=Violaceomyces palustris TaxID=1673888 RepID=A0ACD0P7U7_9BASI|nr:hypothetical protein IE53DRAFT_383248 [Violaceomyces palustris]
MPNNTRNRSKPREGREVEEQRGDVFAFGQNLTSRPNGSRLSSSRPTTQRHVRQPLLSTSLPFVLLVLVLLAMVEPTWSKYVLSPFDCSKVTTSSSSSSPIYDLSKIPFPLTTSNTESTPPSETKTSIQINLCKELEIDSKLPETDQCPKGTRVCILISSIKEGKEMLIQAIPVAGDFPKSSGDHKSMRVEAEQGDKLEGGETSLKLEFTGDMYAGKQQSLELEMVCDQKVSEDDATPTARKYDRKDGKLEMRWPTKFACSTNNQGGNGGGSGGEGGKGKEPEKGGDGAPSSSSSSWGFFNWFFFILFGGLAVYFGVGMYNNYNRYGASGWDLIPHRDFWRESPYIAKDAASHVWRSVSGGGSGGGGGARGAYEPL